MSLTNARGDGAPTSEMNVTPMIDVLLVLIVVFMLLQQVRFVTPAMLVERSKDGSSSGGQVVLEVLREGGYRLNGSPVAQAELGMRLAETFEERPTKVLFLSVAANRRYQEVLEAMDVARGAGIQVVGLMPR